MNDIFRNLAQTIQVYIGSELKADPFEENTTVVLYNPIPIKAIVSDLNFDQIKYKMPSISTSKAKEVLVQKKDEKVVLMSQKIVIDGEEYEGWKENGRMQKKNEGDYIRIFAYSRK
jgi:hypothetical protein